MYVKDKQKAMNEMDKLKKAENLYLRGFGSEYIKRRTGVSMQSLLKQLRAMGIVHSKEEIIRYQIDYISNRYTLDEIESAYTAASAKYSDMFAACRGRHVEILGCAFGNIAPVMKALLGEKQYGILKSKCWKIKQIATMESRYGVRNVFQKETFAKFVSDEAVIAGRQKREATLISRYGVTSPNADPKICAKMMKSARITNRAKYGVDNPMQCPDIAKISSEHRQKTMESRYGVKNSVESEEIRNRIFETRRMNGTLNSSVPEDTLFNLLVKTYGEEDVLRNVIVDNRYPFHVDFYIKSRDLFIELNGDKCHGGHWYEPNNKQDQQRVRSWIENAERLEITSGKVSRYRKYLKTWTVTDVAKRIAAKTANLNYLVFWDGSNKRGVARLSDARDWFSENMPYPWRQSNMY